MESIDILRERVNQNKVIWRGRSLKRMIERGISRHHVKEVLKNGKVIEEYPDDFPFPSFLILGYVDKNPLHVVCSMDGESVWIITSYKPSLDIWEDDFQTRRR